MLLHYDEDLIEAIVSRRASGRRQEIPCLQVVRFHREREQLYSILDPDERNDAFRRLHREWFREWGLERLLTEPLKEFPILLERLRLLAFRRSRDRHDEGAELYVNGKGERNGLVVVRPEQFERRAELVSFLRHELMHLQDMVDPAFGYQAELPVSGALMNHRRAAGERYHVLWDVSIDGRLTQAGRGTVASREQRWSEFAGVFGFWPEARQRELFDALWASPVPTHSALVELSCDPRQLQTGGGPQPGAACPLCRFPTFAWADPAGLTAETVTAIQREFPRWRVEDGACARCAEIYRRQMPFASSRSNTSAFHHSSIPAPTVT